MKRHIIAKAYIIAIVGIGGAVAIIIATMWHEIQPKKTIVKADTVQKQEVKPVLDSVSQILADPEYEVDISSKIVPGGKVQVYAVVFYSSDYIFSRNVEPTEVKNLKRVSVLLKRLCDREYLKDYYPTLLQMHKDGL
jgi:hypothetical protein